MISSPEDLAQMIAAEKSRGMTSADVTRLTGANKLEALRKAERAGLLKSNPTNNRQLGRRWWSTEHYPANGLRPAAPLKDAR